MSNATAARIASSQDASGRRLTMGVLVSLLLHGLVLSLQFGIPGLRPGPGTPIAVRLTPPPATEPIPPPPAMPVPVPPPASVATAPVPPALPQQKLPVPHHGFTVVDPVVPAPPPAAPAPPPAPPPRRVAKRRRKMPTPRVADGLHARVIAQDAHQDSTFDVPLPAVETDPAPDPLARTDAPAAADKPVDDAAADAEDAQARRARVAEEREHERTLRREADEARLRAQAEAQMRAEAAQERQRLAEQSAQFEAALADEQRARMLADQRKAEEVQARARQEEERRLAEQQRAQQQVEQERARQLAERQRIEQAEQERAQQLVEQQRIQQAEQERAQQLAEQQRIQQAERERAQQLAEQQRVQQAERERAQQLAEQQRIQQAERERVQQLAEQRRAEDAVRQQLADQERARQADLAARRQAEENARLVQEQARRDRVRDQPGAGGAASGPARTDGRSGDGAGRGNGDGTLPRAALGSDLASRAREMMRGIDILKPVPQAVRPAEDAARAVRRALAEAARRDIPLRMYIDSVRQKIERNAVLSVSQLAADVVRTDPIVSVAIRSDGSVEDVVILRSSGRADIDEFVRRVVRLNARYAAFPPNVAANYDVIELRRVWRFAGALRLLEEMR
ncbi:MAG: TonB C-terminal domain-containing protein [Massilia sp.]|nr:TonB C-terminal domain-containing protein [Massilia sp.]